MNFQEKLQDLRKDKAIAIAGKKAVEENKQEEIKKATKSIEEKYSGKIEKYEKKFNFSVNNIHEYCRLIEEYSTFYRNDIAYILVDLLNVFEGKEHILAQLSYHPTSGSPAQVQDILVIIEKNNYDKIKDKKYLEERYLYHLIKNYKIVLLDGRFSLCMPETLKFYKFETGTINQNISLKGYAYLKDFIDMVINYRLENKKEDITDEELENLKNQFILSNREKIETNLYINAEIDMINYKKEVEDTLEHNKKLLKRRINKIENK